MKINIVSFVLMGLMLVASSSCMESYLEFEPEDKITSAIFPEGEDDIQLLLNGTYSYLRDRSIYNQGLFGFGILDGATPNAYNWGNTAISRAGNGQLTSGVGEMLRFRWERSYGIISRANYLLKALEEVELSEDITAIYMGEAHFLRGLAYAVLAESYGGVPLILSDISAEEARTIPRSSLEDTWKQVESDYDVAIANLEVNAPQTGRATRGAAMAMKMRAFLYQGKYPEVIQIADQIDALGKYALFPSYEGLFKLENENNQEVIFDIQYSRGSTIQGSFIDQYCGTGTGSWTRGSRYVPTDDLVNSYERVDGEGGVYFDSEIDLDNPYEGWDPRMAYTVVVPGSSILGYRFPNYLYPGGAFNHAGCRIKHLATRKYREYREDNLAPAGESDLNYIVIRYADVLLSKAEALIESGGDIDAAIGLINQVRTEREDVKISALPNGLSQEEARAKLRHERRIEFALEGLYWMDIKRWEIGNEIYPLEVKDHTGGLIETRFPNGYLDYYNLLPIPDSEVSLNENLIQNPGW